MHNQTGLKFLFVVNPISGGKEKNDWETAIRTYFKDKPHTIEIFMLTGEGDESSIRHHIESVQPDRVVAVGGDGTVKQVAGIVKERPLPLGILPAGSANGMAKELNLPEDVQAALDVVENGVIKKIDAIRVNDELCLHLSDLGLNAMLVKNFENSSSRGMWGYGRAIFRMLWEKQKMKVILETDESTTKREAYMVAIANARMYGTGANINPDGDVADGLFEVVIVRKLNVFEIAKAIFTNKSFDAEKIEVLPTKSLKLSVHRKAYFQIDGEFKGKVTKITATIMPGILQVLLPEENNHA